MIDYLQVDDEREGMFMRWRDVPAGKRLTVIIDYLQVDDEREGVFMRWRDVPAGKRLTVEGLEPDTPYQIFTRTRFNDGSADFDSPVYYTMITTKYVYLSI